MGGSKGQRKEGEAQGGRGSPAEEEEREMARWERRALYICASVGVSFFFLFLRFLRCHREKKKVRMTVYDA